MEGRGELLSVRVSAGVSRLQPRPRVPRRGTRCPILPFSPHVVVHHVAVAVDVAVVVVVLRVQQRLCDVLLGVVGWRRPPRPVLAPPGRAAAVRGRLSHSAAREKHSLQAEQFDIRQLDSPHDLDPVIDIVRDADVLEVVAARGHLAPLTEVDVEVVQGDRRMGSASSSHLRNKEY